MVYRLAIVMCPPPPPHFGWPKMNFDRISRHFRSIRNFKLFSQNGCRRPFWMTENHFRSHFSPFQINGNCLYLVHKMAPGGHFGWPKITFDRIVRHFRSIRNFFFHKMAAASWLQSVWMTENHFRSHFSPFQINTQLFYLQNGCQRPFWMTENHFW